MSDSSLTGSARTEIDAVDKFLMEPTTHTDFVRALRASNEASGDAGLSDFRVDRTRVDVVTASGHAFRDYGYGAYGYDFTNFAMRSDDASYAPTVELYMAPTKDAMKKLGQGLYLRSLPNRDQAALGTVLGEIVDNPVRAMAIPGKALLSRAAARQGRALPSLLTKQASKRHSRVSGLSVQDARASADDYLAYVFGVRPTVQDLDKLAESISRSRLIAETVSRTGMKRMRRRRSNPHVERVAVAIDPNFKFLAAAGSNQFSLTGERTAKRIASQDVWFSASYKMPVSDTDNWLAQCSDLFHTMDRITGLGLDVKVAWDLIPFSFLVDWFANTGDYLENRTVAADYNIVCEYGYVMCHTRHQKIVTGSGQFALYGEENFGGGSHGFISNTELVESKIRTSANSFGFYTDFDGLNSFQWSALTALGLTFTAGTRPTTRS
jgi:hypothetical protein